MSEWDLSGRKKMVTSSFERLSQAVGVHVMVLVGEHALWKTKYKHSDASLITVSEEGFNLAPLDDLPVDRACEIVSELVLAIISTLGRLVGVQLAQQLTEQLMTPGAKEETRNWRESQQA